ncbi:MAG: hypothetical protein B6244_11415, partial [Candidatus Cloacimonetes bacterium 4572_55]
FYHGFKESPSLNGVAFEETVHNIRARRGQYDIVLYGQDCVAVVEVKHKFHPKDVDIAVEAGLFVFCQSGNNMKSLNDESFTPRIY